jgi:integrase/recombinase XerD
MARDFLYLKNVKKYSRSSTTIALCGIKFFFEHTLHRDFPILNFIRPHREKKLPAILSPDEVRRILQLLRLPAYRVCLSTIYSCGLRLQEGTHLQVADLDSSRMMVHLRDGKGAKDRYAALPILGPPQRDECYGFHPAIALGGPGAADTWKRVKLREHLALLAQL